MLAYAYHEVSQAQLLLEQTWVDLEPAVTAMAAFFGAAQHAEDSGIDLAATRLWLCDRCSKPLYRTRGFTLCTLSPTEQRRAGALTLRPIVLQVGNVRVLVCSRGCAVDALQNATHAELYGSGYVLW